jgi:hypothetical protein
LRLPVVRPLPDGTYLSVLINPKIRGGRRERIVAAARAGVADLDPDEAYLVRVVEYDVPDRDGNGTGELIVLLTSILDPGDARPDELADTYHLRWEVSPVPCVSPAVPLPERRAFPPGDWTEHLPRVLAELGRKPLPARRHRTCPRAVKRARHNSYRVKKPDEPASTRHPGPATIRFWRIQPRTA